MQCIVLRLACLGFTLQWLLPLCGTRRRILGTLEKINAHRNIYTMSRNEFLTDFFIGKVARPILERLGKIYYNLYIKENKKWLRDYIYMSWASVLKILQWFWQNATIIIPVTFVKFTSCECFCNITVGALAVSLKFLCIYLRWTIHVGNVIL